LYLLCTRNPERRVAFDVREDNLWCDIDALCNPVCEEIQWIIAGNDNGTFRFSGDSTFATCRTLLAITCSKLESDTD
jgi:hypothetical protein